MNVENVMMRKYENEKGVLQVAKTRSKQMQFLFCLEN
jgi:hypothetical protein